MNDPTSRSKLRGTFASGWRFLTALIWYTALCVSVWMALPASAATVTPMVGAYQDTSYYIDSSGRLYGWGKSTTAQLADGSITVVKTPKLLGSGYLSAAIGVAHAAAVKPDGSLWAWGDNSHGQLGDGTSLSRTTPTLLGAGFSGVWAGDWHTVGLKTDGSLWAWGGNWEGQLGDGTRENRLTPVQIGSGFKSAAVVGYYAFALKTDGTLWAWGRNSSGELGDGSRTNQVRPVEIGSGFSQLATKGASQGHMAAIKSDGSLWAWGRNNCGQLGDGTNTDRLAPVRVGSGYTTVSAGAWHTLATKSDGSVWAWGCNGYGALGDGTTAGWFDQRRVASGFASVLAGDETSFGIKTDGSVWSWGRNNFAQLGLGTTANGLTPEQVGAGYKTLSTVSNMVLAVKTDGSLMGWGDNINDVLLTGTGGARKTPSLIGEGFSVVTSRRSLPLQTTFAIKTDGTLWGWGANRNGQLGVAGAPSYSASTPLLIGSGYKEVASGDDYALAVKTDGTLWGWGANGGGQLGGGALQDHPVPVLLGSGYSKVSAGQGGVTLALKTDGTLWSWGNNESGQLGDGSTTNRTFAVQVGTGFKDLFAGNDTHSLALKTDGTLWAWGLNSCGQIGDGTKTNRLTPFQVGSGFVTAAAGGCTSVGIKADGTLWQWGGQVNSLTPVQVGTGYSSVSAGAGHVLAIRTDGSVWAWGSNSAGQLGSGVTETYQSVPAGIFAVKPGAPTDVFASAGNQQVSVSFLPPASNGGATITDYTVTASPGGQTATASFSPATVTGLTNGTQYTFTVTATNAMGVGVVSTPSNVVSPLAPVSVGGTGGISTKVAAFDGVSYYIDSNGRLFGWGKNTSGQMGDGAITHVATPWLMGQAYAAVAKGASHVVALKADGTIWAWGAGGKVGDGTGLDRTNPVQIGSGYTGVWAGSWHSLALKADGSLWSWGSNDSGQLGIGKSTDSTSPTKVGDGFKAVAISLKQTFAIKTDGSLWAWGQNNSGQLGDGTTTNQAAPVQIGSGYSALASGGNHGHMAAIKIDGSLWVWGQNSCGELGDGTNNTRMAPVQVGTGFSSVSVGGCYTLAIKTDASVWAWGNNNHGQMGDGTNNNSSSPRQVGTGYLTILAGDEVSLGLQTDGSLWAWGKNNVNQLGNGTTTDSLSPQRVGNDYRAMAVHNSTVLAVKQDGSLMGWGDNLSDLLLTGTGASRQTPYLIGEGFSAVTASPGGLWQNVFGIKTDGSLWGWGPNQSGQLGLAGAPAFTASTPLLIGSGYKEVASGYSFTVAVKTDGTLWSWGENGGGQLGDGTTQQRTGPVKIGSGFSKVAIGQGGFVLALKTDGTLWSWGPNSNGQLGDGTKINRIAPVQIGSNFQHISAGNDLHAVGIKTDGTLWAWGQNNCGQIGDGSTSDRLTPVMIGTGYTAVAASGCYNLALKTDGTMWRWGDVTTLLPEQIDSGYIAVSAGGSHILAVKADGSVWSWGNNGVGQLGYATQTTYSYQPKGVFTVLPGAPTQVEASAGSENAAVCFAAPASNGGAAITGYTVTALPGGNVGTSDHCPVVVNGLTNGTTYTFTVTATTTAGTSVASTPSNPVKPLVSANTIASTAYQPLISAASDGSLFVNADGSAWGVGNLPNIWPGATSPVRLFPTLNVVAVAAQGGNAFALTGDGTLWGTGWNGNGELADGTKVNRPQPQRVPGLPALKAISGSNWGNLLTLSDDGSVWTWGRNESGQLGDGTQVDNYVPGKVSGLANIVKISANNGGGLALQANGTVWVWGKTCCGSAGDGKETTNEADSRRLEPTQVHDLVQVVAIASGDQHHLALRADGTVWSWGIGDMGENGTGDLTKQYTHAVLPTQVPGLDHVVAIDARGQNLSLALKDDGTVWAWGSNSFGRLGIVGPTYGASPVQVPGLADIVAISAGAYHVLAMRRDGVVLAWGRNANGQLGDNTLDDRIAPAPILAPGGVGLLNTLAPAPTTYNKLPNGWLELSARSGKVPLTVTAKAVNVNDSDGTVKAYYWSTNDNQESTAQETSFTFSQPGTYQINLLIEDNLGARTNLSQSVFASPSNVVISATPKVGVSGGVGVALKNDGSLLTWGSGGLLGFYDEQAQWSHPSVNPLPIANGMTGVIDVLVSGWQVYVVMADGSVSAWGGNSFGQLGVGSQVPHFGQPQLLKTLPAVKAIAANGNSAVAATRDGRVFAWGGNVYGQLGVGDNKNYLEPVEVAGLSSIVSVVAGGGFMAALKSDGTVWAWGDNSGYQLGDKTRTARSRPIEVPGLVAVTKLFANNNNLFAQKADGTMWVTGYGPGPGVSGDPGPQNGPRHLEAYDGFVQLAGSWDFMLGLKADGTVWVGGMNSSRALVFQDGSDIAGMKQLPGITGVISITANGGPEVMLVRRDGTVLSWGANTNGQLGDGTLAFRTTPVVVVNEKLDGPLDLIPEVPNAISVTDLSAFQVKVSVEASVSAGVNFNSDDLDKAGNVFVVAYLPANSSLLGGTVASQTKDNAVGVVPAVLTRGGWKQASTTAPTEPLYTGTLSSVNSTFALYDATQFNQTKDNGLFCIGYSGASATSAKGLIRSVVSGADTSLTQCPPIQIGAPPSTSDTSPPSSPLNLTAKAAGPSQVLLSWSAATDNVGVTRYNIYRGTTIIATLDNVTSYTDSGPQASTSYSYSIMACDAAFNCSGQSTPVQTATPAQPTLSLSAGWNLVGNGGSTAINVPRIFGDPSRVLSIWKWVKAGSTPNITYPAWAFYTPLQSDGGAAYAASNGFDTFSSIASGEGFWVNAKVAMSVPMTAPGWILSSVFAPGQSKALTPGWSLIATGEAQTASAFNKAIGSTPPAAGTTPVNLTSLWAWQSSAQRWYFYAPSLEANSGLNAYLNQNNYLDLGSVSFAPTMGFWVNR